MSVEHLHTATSDGLLDSSALPPELWSCEPRYVKVSTISTLLPPTCTNVPGDTVVSVV